MVLSRGSVGRVNIHGWGLSPGIRLLTGGRPCAARKLINIASIRSPHVEVLASDDTGTVAMAAEGPLAAKDGMCSSVVMD